MKILFEDGELDKDFGSIFCENCVIDARYGFTHNDRLLQMALFSDREEVYTNSLISLDNVYAWNETLGVPEIYLRRNGDWVRIDKLTNRELRRDHNILKMYFSGEFRE